VFCGTWIRKKKLPFERHGKSVFTFRILIIRVIYQDTNVAAVTFNKHFNREERVRLFREDVAEIEVGASVINLDKKTAWPTILITR
jgi:hypothetical protein